MSNARSLWPRILIIAGSIGMLVGALDPLEGSVLILPGSALVALGTFLGQSERSVIAYRMGVFILITIGVGAMWALSSAGGFGGHSGRSIWWGVLILPYLVGWSMGIWGPRSPLWLLLFGSFIGIWYLALPVMILSHSAGDRQNGSGVAVVILAVLGLVTIGGCIFRGRKEIARRA